MIPMKLNFRINLTKKQKEAYDLLHMEDTQYLVARWSRQSGKSVFAEICLIESMCKSLTFNAYISPTYSQGRKVYKEITQLLESTGIIKKANASTLTIQTIFNSYLQFFTMESPTSIRGYTISGLLVLDECAFFPDQLSDGSEPWSSVIMPITKARHPKTLIISTPKGKRGMFYDMYMKAVSGEKGYREISATIYDDDLVSSEEIEDIKKSVSPIGFEEEFMVKFLDSSLTFFKNYENQFRPIRHSYEQTFIGVDLSGNGEDATILTKINEKNEVEQFEITGTLDQKYRRIAEIIDGSKNLQMCYLENNGLGAPMINEIMKLVRDKSKLKEWTTTNSSKEEIVSELAIAIAKDEIYFNEGDKSLFSELGTFTANYTKTGHLKFEAQGGHHDDRVMSLAIALRCKNECFKRFTHTFLSVVRV